MKSRRQFLQPWFRSEHGLDCLNQDKSLTINKSKLFDILFGSEIHESLVAFPSIVTPRPGWFLPSPNKAVRVPLYESVVKARLTASSTVNCPLAGLLKMLDVSNSILFARPYNSRKSPGAGGNSSHYTVLVLRTKIEVTIAYTPYYCDETTSQLHASIDRPTA